MKPTVCLLLLLALFFPAQAQQPTISDEPLSERRVSYTMDVALDPESRTVTGTERVTWRNPGNTPVSELQFHLYLNAFKPGSTYMNESGGVHRGFSAEGDDVYGNMEITSMQVTTPDVPTLSSTYWVEANDLTDRITYIQPDDNNTEDQTVISVPLPAPVQPGETIVLDIDFTSKLPKISARTGWEQTSGGAPFYMVAQWFPKLGVYEVPGQRYVPADAPSGQWNTHQFHANSEFYADFGTYDVTITTPENYTIGASGLRVDEQTGGGERTVTYRADDVHDFAWTASPAYLEFTDTWQHVNLRLLLLPEHDGQAERHFEAAKIALEKFDEWVGEYPYTTLTLVDGVGGANGMEYPTLITCGTAYMLPEWARLLEIVTIHEFGHQYFYGLLASNEFEEAWLDEGMNSYLETRIMDTAYGPGSALDLPGLRISDGGAQRLGYTKVAPSRGALFTRSWEYKFGDYGKASYAKPATVMNTLERYLGWETMREFLRTYYDRWRFHHPTTRDVQDVAEEVAGEDLDWFFDQYIYGTAVVDYAVNRVRVRRLNEDEDNPIYENEVRLERREDGIFPQTLRVHFADGTTEDVSWNGEDPWKVFTFTKPARLTEAYLDPDNAVWLDINRLNNRRTFEAGNPLARKYQFKVAVWAQQLFYLIASII
ncbi:MAG TPA: M1 family metallopeptidase [Rhodothermales bacterium]|nr:M1 family metallopeptidase [Rhodothermales bacterium]